MSDRSDSVGGKGSPKRSDLGWCTTYIVLPVGTVFPLVSVRRLAMFPWRRSYIVCASQSENASYDLLNGILREVRKSQCCAEGLSKAGKERVLEVVFQDVSCHLLIQILETQDELGDGFAGSLFDSVELAKQFEYGDRMVEKFQKLCVDILECGELPRVVWRIPSCRWSSRESVNSAILEASISAAGSCCVEWLACHVFKKEWMWASASGPSV